VSRWQRWLNRLKWNIRAAGWLYGGLSLLYIVGRYTVGEQWTLVEVANSLTPAILLPVCVLLPLILLQRRWRLAAVLLPALVLLVVHYAPFFLPDEKSVPDEAMRLRILTFNIGSKVDDYPCMIGLIRSVDADIVAVQELLSAPAAELSAGLADIYPYQALNPVDIFAGGVGIFSRYPVVDDKYLSDMSLGGQRTRLALSDNRAITLLNVHPVSPRILASYNSSRRSQEIDFLLDVAAQENNPVLLSGDFNLTDLTDDYGKISPFYGDAFKDAGTGFGTTFPNLGKFARPLQLVPSLIRIDYVFFSAEWVALDAYVLPDSAGSDHYPLFAELALTTPG
jgi:endonuclease/exonuclease/phosphatase (EEP) superfamily protein YafD